MRWSDGLADSMDVSLSKVQEVVKDQEVHGVAELAATERATRQRSLP